MTKRIVFCLLIASAVSAAAAEARPARGEQALAEEQRQLQVNTRLGSVSSKLALLADDIRSNELTKELHADRLVSMSSSVTAINKTNVLGAADALGKARKEMPKFKPHVDVADKEIQTAVVELDKLLKGSPNAELESLLAELRVIIKKQEQRKKETSAWGKQLLEGQAADDNQRLELALLQSQILPRIQTFHERLKASAKDETDEGAKAKMVQADALMVQKPTKGMLESSVQNIREKQPIPAVAQQDKVLEVLHEVEKILEDESTVALSDFADLEKAMKDLESLKNELEAATPQEFQAQLQNFQSQQADVNAALANIDVAALQTALAEAAQHLGNGEQAQAAAADAAALAALHAALEAGKEPGTEPGTEPEIGIGIGPPELAVIPHQSLDPKEMPRMIANSKTAEGDRKGPNKALIGALNPREQEALQENYARELPAEYKGLLEEYYEALSK